MTTVLKRYKVEKQLLRPHTHTHIHIHPYTRIQINICSRVQRVRLETITEVECTVGRQCMEKANWHQELIKWTCSLAGTRCGSLGCPVDWSVSPGTACRGAGLHLHWWCLLLPQKSEVWDERDKQHRARHCVHTRCREAASDRPLKKQNRWRVQPSDKCLIQFQWAPGFTITQDNNKSIDVNNVPIAIILPGLHKHRELLCQNSLYKSSLSWINNSVLLHVTDCAPEESVGHWCADLMCGEPKRKHGRENTGMPKMLET